MIIVSGCSWSDDKLWSPIHKDLKCDWPKWYHHINTDQEVLSVGLSGNSNGMIIDRTIEQLLTKPNVTNVILALTDWTRFSILDKCIHPEQHWLIHNLGGERTARALSDGDLKEVMKRNDEENSQFINENSIFVKTVNFRPHKTLWMIVNETMIKLKTIWELCKARDINLYVFQMIPSSYFFAEETLKAVVGNKLFQEMYLTQDAHFLNFPFFTELGGTSVEEEMKLRDDYSSMIISNLDRHPNKKGNKYIGDWFNKHVKDLK